MIRGLAFIFSFCCTCSFGAPLHFLSPAFQHLDPQEISQLSPSDGVDRALINLHLFEAYDLRKDPHAAHAALVRAEAICHEKLDGVTADARARAHVICVLALAQSVGETHAFQAYRMLSQMNQHLTAYYKAPLSGNEKLYVDARIFMALPEFSGRDMKKALINLQFLLRQAPDVTMTQHWIARAHLALGNRAAATENFNIAYHSKLNDGRTSFFYDGQQIIDERDKADGISYGFRPALVVGPSVGFGVGLAIWDDRIADRNRAFELGGSAATRNVFGVNGRYEEGELLHPFRVTLAANAYWRSEDFFGFGDSTLLTSHTVLKTQAWDTDLKFSYPILPELVASLGWNVGRTQVTSGSVTTIANAFVSKPYVRLEWDRLDSHYDPWRGFRLAYQYGLSRRALGSDVDFGQSLFRGDAVIPLGARKAIWIKTDLEWVDGSVPYSVIPKWGGQRAAPGSRRNRFQDRAVWQSTLEPRIGLGGNLLLGAFFNAGTASPSFGDLFKTKWLFGGGGLLEFNGSRYRSRRIRAEVGYFGGEWVGQVFASGSF